MYVASQIILLPASHIYGMQPHAQALPHLSLISERLNLKYSFESLPADTQRQIKRLTVESKEFSLSLHKHESMEVVVVGCAEYELILTSPRGSCTQTVLSYIFP